MRTLPSDSKVIKNGYSVPAWGDLGIRHGLAGKSGQTPVDLYYAKQVHGVGIYEVVENNQFSRPEADIIWTRLSQQPIGVQTADCLPVLIYHPLFVCAIHAGWRGFAQGIFEVAKSYLAEQFGSIWSLSQSQVFLGPCISREAFEVGPEVVESFGLSLKSEKSGIVTAGRDDRLHIDLQALAVRQLINLGFLSHKIVVYRSCTFSSKELWHSYRRDGQDAGRNWAWLSL